MVSHRKCRWVAKKGDRGGSRSWGVDRHRPSVTFTRTGSSHSGTEASLQRVREAERWRARTGRQPLWPAGGAQPMPPLRGRKLSGSSQQFALFSSHLWYVAPWVEKCTVQIRGFPYLFQEGEKGVCR